MLGENFVLVRTKPQPNYSRSTYARGHYDFPASSDYLPANNMSIHPIRCGAPIRSPTIRYLSLSLSKSRRPPLSNGNRTASNSAMLSTIIHRRALTMAARTAYRPSNGCRLSGGSISASSACSTSMMHRSRHIATSTTATTSFCNASPLHRYHHQPKLAFFRRTNFSYAGPRKLSDILKSELLVDKSSTEIVSCFVLA